MCPAKLLPPCGESSEGGPAVTDTPVCPLRSFDVAQRRSLTRSRLGRSTHLYYLLGERSDAPGFVDLPKVSQI
jgi:hypothetical protein